MKFEGSNFGIFGGLHNNNIPLDETDVIIQGIPYEGATSGKKGASLAPTSLRLISKDMQTVSRRGIDFNNLKIRDVGDVQLFPLDGKATRDSIEKSFLYLLQNKKCSIITIGGDHSVTFPLIKALSQKGKIGIIWFDAHRDLLNEFLNSKYSHGSPLRRSIELGSVSKSNVLLVGTRYMTTEEENFTKANNIKEIKMVDIERTSNVIELFTTAVNDVMEGVDYIHVSIDMDILDPAFAPGTGTPVGGGMATSMLMNLVGALPMIEKIRTFDLVEISPPLDPSGITIKVAMGLLTEILAKISTKM
ncbi:MAG: agmatinase [Candidatus Hodarchaeales archaeon]